MGANRRIHAVTRAFGFTGQYIARRLLSEGKEVMALTNSPQREHPFGSQVRAFSYNFDVYPALVDSLREVDVLYNNYWVRFNHEYFTYAAAVEHSRTLFAAAWEAGVRRIVHISITNPSEDSRFEYFSGKARLEKELINSGISYSILRPAVIFGKEDILINNIAWFLRRFPVFGVFGNGGYKLEPIYVDDLAALAVKEGEGNENSITDAVGPESFSYRELVSLIADAIGRPRPIVLIPPTLGWLIGWMVGKMVRDVPITRDEIEGLMEGRLYTGSPPTGETKLSEWLKENAGTVGANYSSELARRTNQKKKYNT